jgi:hypothetical protein
VRALATGVIVVLALGCSQVAEPPGPSTETAPASDELEAPPDEPAASEVKKEDLEPGHGAKIASIAMRTWVYLQPDDHATKLGYLRAGAVVDRAKFAAGNRGCDGGWYRIVPRGYVCVGKGASLDVRHQVVQAALQGPRRGEPEPYRYVISRHPPPHLYFKLPSEAEQQRAEGKRRAESMALFGERERELLGAAEPVPEFLLQGEPLPKPYGAARGLHLGAHRGRAGEDSAFGLIATFDWTERRMGLTTELDLIALDRTRRAPASSFRGIAIAEEGVVPAFVSQHGLRTHTIGDDDVPRSEGEAAHRSAWLLTGRTRGGSQGLVETTQGLWLPAGSLRIADVREDPAGFARDGRKWIDVSIKRQMLVAYEGKRPVYATLVSTGRGELGDPEKTDATIRGTFMIHAKHVSGTMDGDETEEDTFDLRDVPYIQYFHDGYALHGAYWHDEFGKVRSHGCINLAPADAAWLFEWTEPEVPPGWHGALNLQAGTLVYIHK